MAHGTQHFFRQHQMQALLEALLLKCRLELLCCILLLTAATAHSWNSLPEKGMGGHEHHMPRQSPCVAALKLDLQPVMSGTRQWHFPRRISQAGEQQ